MFSILSVYDYLFDNFGSIVLFLLFISLIKHIYNNSKSRSHLPPGPTGLPVVGYLPYLGKEPHKDIAKLSVKYGNVFTLQLGIHNVVILNDWEAVKDAFHKDQFLGRPRDSPFSFSGTVSFSDESGSVWREHRRFAFHLLRDLGFGKRRMEDRIIEEIGYLTNEIDKTNGQPFNAHTLLVSSVSNNISHLVFGHRFDFTDPKMSLFDKVLDAGSSRFSQIGMLALAPVWFSRIILKVGALGKKKAFQTIFSIFENEISNHKKSFKSNNIRDYIDGYLEEMEVRKKKDPNTSFNDGKLLANCRSFFGAGSVTVRTATEWGLILSVVYPEHQKRMQAEIDSVIGKERTPAWADRTYLPFTQAFICEMFRFKTIVPLNLMRSSLEDSSILGHFIPKNTRILANLWAVHNDPKLWDNPDMFDPNRFLSDDGKEVVKIEALIPFSMGKRSCVGETLARVEVFLFLTSLLQRYTISGADDKVLTLEDRFGLTLQPKDTLWLKLDKRIN